MLAGILDADADNADLAFLVALVGLWLVGIVTLVQSRGKSWLQGVAWIATGFLALGWLFMTP